MQAKSFAYQAAKQFAARFHCARQIPPSFRAKKAVAMFSGLRPGEKSTATLSAKIHRKMRLIRFRPTHAQTIDDLRQERSGSDSPDKSSIGATVKISDPNGEHIMIEDQIARNRN